ncbi:hypothetical protein NLJ89_g6164 [Agrocybe chaxingu]|uniref:Uncharacterized protein n=1 Tax=Agrocybe chaxingu TaxID=84603 RepID=A0A9W8JZ65_9AGAR|nr:hypothetical protein NLJ89_g6164 [Agrocybe chaxingu]
MPTIPPYLTGGALLHPIQPHRSSSQRDNPTTRTGTHINSQSAAIASAEDHQLPQTTNFHQHIPLNHPDESPFPDTYPRPPASGSSNELVVADMQANPTQEPVVIINGNHEPNLGPPLNTVRRKSFAQNLLDDQLSDGEMSMELATPLLPVSMISAPVHPTSPLAPSTAASSQAPSSSPGAAAGGLSPLISIPSLTLPIEGGDPRYVNDPHGVMEVSDRRTGGQINEEHDDHGVGFNIRTDREHDQIGPQPSPSSSLGTSPSSPHSVTASMPLEDPFIVPRLVPGSMLTSTPPPSHLSHRHSHHSHHHSNPFDLHVDHGNPDDTDGPPGYEYEHSFDDTHHSFDLRSDEGSPTLSQMMLSAAASATSSAGLTSGARSGTHSGTNLPDSMRSPAHSLGVLHPAQTSAVNARARVNAEDLTSELERVEAELMSTQTELEVGEDVLVHLEDLVKELRRRERQEAEDEKQSGPP